MINNYIVQNIFSVQESKEELGLKEKIKKCENQKFELEQIISQLTKELNEIKRKKALKYLKSLPNQTYQLGQLFINKDDGYIYTVTSTDPLDIWIL